MPDDDREALEEAMASKMLGSMIAQALRDDGHAVSNACLQRHRRKACAGL
jgi:hypothetical protein